MTLSEEYVRTNVSASDWRQAVNEVGSILVEKGKCDQEFINQMIETVDKLGPYMILLPDVALFHAPPGPYVHEPCLSFVTLKDPVYFSEFENQRIKCAFALGAVDSESHMTSIQQVAMLLQNQRFIELATNNGSLEELMESMKNTLD